MPSATLCIASPKNVVASICDESWLRPCSMPYQYQLLFSNASEIVAICSWKRATEGSCLYISREEYSDGNANIGLESALSAARSDV